MFFEEPNFFLLFDKNGIRKIISNSKRGSRGAARAAKSLRWSV